MSKEDELRKRVDLMQELVDIRKDLYTVQKAGEGSFYQITSILLILIVRALLLIASCLINTKEE